MKQKFKQYFKDIAIRTAALSNAKRLQVGCIAVKDNRIISIGYNGGIAGDDNVCEDLINGELVTKDTVIHAEKNCLLKLARSHESSEGADLFITHQPCMDCSKLIYTAGIRNVYYIEPYRLSNGIEFLQKCGINVECIKYIGEEVPVTSHTDEKSIQLNHVTQIINNLKVHNFYDIDVSTGDAPTTRIYSRLGKLQVLFVLRGSRLVFTFSELPTKLSLATIQYSGESLAECFGAFDEMYKNYTICKTLNEVKSWFVTLCSNVSYTTKIHNDTLIVELKEPYFKCVVKFNPINYTYTYDDSTLEDGNDLLHIETDDELYDLIKDSLNAVVDCASVATIHDYMDKFCDYLASGSFK
jgi:dCMP deaminase